MLDFATGQKISPDNIGRRHYHHVYPDALLKEYGIQSYYAVNCAFIEDKTNLTIGRKDPPVYLTDRYTWTSQAIVEERLKSHLIPIPELANGGYQWLSDSEREIKLHEDFDRFRQRRAELVHAAVLQLADGNQPSITEIYSNH